MEWLLLVEDNPGDVRLFREYLRDDTRTAGTFEVISASSLAQAAQVRRSTPPAAVVVDLNLPFTTGQETVEAAIEHFADWPIVILTGFDDLELARGSVRRGVQDYLVKNELNALTLRRSLRYAIERHAVLQKDQQQRRSLRQRNEALQAVNNRLEQFTHMLSHDIRGPVASILGLVQISELDPKNTDPDELIGHIKVTARHLDGHLNEVLSLLQQQHSWESQASPQNWEELHAQTVSLLSGSIATAEAEITACFEDTDICYPPSVLKSILLNLLSNAIKYRAPARKPRIALSVRRISGIQRLEVKDNGRGMNLKQCGDKLFQPFRRFHENTEGKGVGLYLITKIVRELGGEVAVDSQVDVGTTFTFTLPEIREEALIKQSV